MYLLCVNRDVILQVIYLFPEKETHRPVRQKNGSSVKICWLIVLLRISLFVGISRVDKGCGSVDKNQSTLMERED